MTRGKLYWVLFALTVIPFVARYQVLLGMRQQIPLALFARIHHGGEAGPGQPTLESNMGFTAQALGTRAAIDWFHGRVPLWNYFEGTGGPLAGEMQSAALFLPFVLLLRSLSGQVFFHLSLQILAGICTFFYLRRIRLGVAASFCGAVFFELNGTFSWMGNAAYNPIAFLPMALLGLERTIDAAQREARGGWLLLAAGAVWSVYAGFPEVAYVDALLVVVYFSFRASQVPPAFRWRLLGKLAVCTLVTLLLIAPLAGQFADFLSFSYRDGRGGAGGASIDPRLGVAALLVPYIYGPIGALQSSYWGDAAGYLGFALAVLAMAGAAWQWRNRVVQCFAAWAVICLLKIYGEPLTTYLLLRIPGLNLVVLDRWLMPSVEFSFAVLGATAIHELYSRPRPSLWVPAVLALAIVCTALCLAEAHGAYRVNGHFHFTYAAVNLLFVVLFTVACCQAAAMGRHAAWVLSSLAVLETLVLFNIPLISAPRHHVLDLDSPAFLKNNLGLQRFYTLGPILPNYGSAFDAAQLNYDDMPVNQYLVQYFKANLDPFMNPTNTKPNWQRGSNPLNNEIIRRNSPAYGRVGVKYVVTDPFENLSPPMRLVYRTEVMKIFELPGFTPYFSGEGCDVRARSRDEVEVRCDRPTTIVRLESFTPNWKASLNGKPAQVNLHHGLFQSVDVPAGTSTLKFTYECPYGRWTVPMFWLGALGLAAMGVRELRARRAAAA
jgi:hypothetical protein